MSVNNWLISKLSMPHILRMIGYKGFKDFFTKRGDTHSTYAALWEGRGPVKSVQTLKLLYA